MPKVRLPICRIKYCKSGGDTHVSQVLTGYTLLEKEGCLQIEVVSSRENFREKGLYEHNSIVEVEINGHILVYDMADGYQSIHRKEVFDRQLDRVSAYYKRSYDPEYHASMRNASKVMPLGLNYYCTCRGNPYDRFELQGKGFYEVRRYIGYLRGERRWNELCNYKNFESTGHYERYKLLFLSRVWDSEHITTEHIKKHYPYFSEDEARCEAEKWKKSLNEATRFRIELIRELKHSFPNSFVGGIEDTPFAREVCPDIIANNKLTNKAAYMKLLKKDYIGITSVGLHGSIGWKLAEYVAAGKAIITDKLCYTVPGEFIAGKNYLECGSVIDYMNACEFLLDNVNAVHKMELANAQYYRTFLNPKMFVYRTIEQYL